MWECASNVTGIPARSEQRKVARILNYHLGIEYTAEKREHGCTQTVLTKHCDRYNKNRTKSDFNILQGNLQTLSFITTP